MAMHWWQEAVVYQLLVPSFRDTNGDGYGDLDGVIQQLDYVKWLGASAIWLSPVYKSPMHELGYDVSDYGGVEPRLGTLGTMDTLLREAHRRDIRIVLDWVPNHTSSSHAWFRESSSGRDAARRDWYIWRDPKPDGSPPNNWISVFGGSVWQWHEPSGQYYLHTFLPEQPDLNWRNGDVRNAMLGTLRFWLDRGVDGFRVDAACLLMKDPEFRDNPPNPDFTEGDGPDSRLLPEHTRDQPGLHETLAEIRSVVDSYADKVLLGEVYLPLAKLMKFYGGERRELHLPLNMLMAWTEWDADHLGRAIQHYQQSVPEHDWPASLISTHDTSRIAMRTSPAQTRNAAMLLMTQRGTVSHYYGEEIGMRGVDIPADRARDPQGTRTGRNRDPERTPMQWSSADGAGFTSAKPWLPIGRDATTANVADQRSDERSLLNLYRRLIELRKHYPTLIDAAHVPVVRDPPVLAYLRNDERASLFVALNLGTEPRTCELNPGHSRVLMSTFLDREGEACSGRVELRGNEGVIIELDA